jgi:transcriptional regulator with XRE-family HTH domain
MPRFESDSDARRLGEALAALRRARGLSQAEAGARVGITSQGWGLYEAGKRPGLFRPDVQRRLTAAVDATPEALALSLPDMPAPPPEPSTGLESQGRAFDTAVAATTRRLQLSTDDLAPWAASGVTLEYAPGRWPRRDQGCVLDMADGRTLIRIYERTEGEFLVVRGGPGGLSAEERLPRNATTTVSAVLARLDQ